MSKTNLLYAQMQQGFVVGQSILQLVDPFIVQSVAIQYQGLKSIGVFLGVDVIDIFNSFLRHTVCKLGFLLRCNHDIMIIEKCPLYQFKHLKRNSK